MAAPVAALPSLALPVGAQRRHVMGTLGTAWRAGGTARPHLPEGWGQVCSRLSRAGQVLSGSRQVLPARRKMLREGRARSQQLCWRGVAQAGSPEGAWGGHWKMPGKTSKVPGTSHHVLYIMDSLAGFSLETFKARATSARGDTGASAQQSSRNWGSLGLQGLLQRHGRLWHGADPGRVSVPQHPSDVPLDGLRELFWPSREASGCREGEHWPGSLPSPSQLGGTHRPPLTLPLSAFQDRTLGSPAHSLSSAPSTMSEVMGPHSPCGGREQRMFSTG